MKMGIFGWTAFMVVVTNADLSMEEVKHMVLRIHEPRAGVDLQALSQTKEPFVQIEVEENNTTRKVAIKEQKKEPKMSLHAILGDKAYINDQWMKVNDTFKGYRLVYIGKRGVVLRSGHRIKTLFITKKNPKPIITFEEKK